MNYIIDILLIAVIVIIVINSSKRGFVSTIIDTFAFGISGICAYKFAPSMSDWCYDLFVRDLVTNKFAKVLDDMSSASPVQDKVSAMIASLPASAVKLAQAVGVDIYGSINSHVGASSVSNEELINTVAEQIGYQIMFAITQVVCFLILFIVIAIVLKFASSFFTFINKIPLIGQMNSALGGVFGLGKAAILMLVITTVVFGVVAVSDSNAFAVAVNNSKLYGFIIEHNPIIGLLI